MQQEQIKIDGRYNAKVNGSRVVVRVLAIRYAFRGGSGVMRRAVFDVMNEASGRRLTFKSPRRFLDEVRPAFMPFQAGDKVENLAGSFGEVVVGGPDEVTIRWERAIGIRYGLRGLLAAGVLPFAHYTPEYKAAKKAIDAGAVVVLMRKDQEYWTLGVDAAVVASVCGVARVDGEAHFPKKDLEAYLRKLLAEGYKAALIDEGGASEQPRPSLFASIHSELLKIIPGTMTRFYRLDAVLDVQRSKDGAGWSYRQGGRAGVWAGATLERLANAMDDGQGPWTFSAPANADLD